MFLDRYADGSSWNSRDEVRSHVFTLESGGLYAWISADKKNSRLLVQLLKNGDFQLIRHLWQSLLATPYSFPIMTHRYGSEVVEAWLFRPTKDQLWAFVRVILDMDKLKEPNPLIVLSKDPNGCLVVIETIQACKKYPDLFHFILPFLQEGEMGLIEHDPGFVVFLSYFRLLNAEGKLKSLRRIEAEYQADGAIGFIALSPKTYGCQVVMEVIELVKDDEESVDYLTTVLERGVISLMEHERGHLVLLCCLQFFSPDACTFILDAATFYFTTYVWVSLSVRVTYFLKILRRCLLVAPSSRRATLHTDIARNAMDLSTHRHGSKILLFILRDLKFEECTKMVVENLMNNYARLSIQRFSHLVVKQCLMFSFLSDVGSCLRILTELLPLSDEVAGNRYLAGIVHTAIVQFELHRIQYEEKGLIDETLRIGDLLRQLDRRE